MKKILFALAATVLSVSAFAHSSSRAHYHNGDGVIVFSRTFQPEVETTYERDDYGRRIRVETTTTCTDTRRGRNNHLRCLDEDVTVTRTVEGAATSPNRPTIEPVIYRSIERAASGARVMVTTTYTCLDARLSPDQTQAICFRWDERIDREIIRRQPNDSSLDLNGDGRIDGWERLLFQSFREVLDN